MADQVNEQHPGEVLLKFIHADTAYLSCSIHGPFKIAGPFPANENLTFACSQCLHVGEKTLEQMLVELARLRPQMIRLWCMSAKSWALCVITRSGHIRNYTASTPMDAVVQAYRDR